MYETSDKDLKTNVTVNFSQMKSFYTVHVLTKSTASPDRVYMHVHISIWGGAHFSSQGAERKCSRASSYCYIKNEKEQKCQRCLPCITFYYEIKLSLLSIHQNELRHKYLTFIKHHPGPQITNDDKLEVGEAVHMVDVHLHEGLVIF